MTRAITLSALFLAACSRPSATPQALTVVASSDWTKTESPQEAKAVCTMLGNYAFIACSRGYLGSGASTNKSSKQYQYGVAACAGAGQTAFNGCMNGAASKYEGKTGKGDCADLTAYIIDSISAGCVKAVNGDAARNKMSKACISTWAPKGALDFQTFCEKKVASQRTENGTAL